MGRTDKALWGGMTYEASDPDTLLNGPVKAIIALVNAALEQPGGRRFLLGPGCRMSSRVPDAHLLAAKEALSTWRRH